MDNSKSNIKSILVGLVVFVTLAGVSSLYVYKDFKKVKSLNNIKTVSTDSAGVGVSGTGNFTVEKVSPQNTKSIPAKPLPPMPILDFTVVFPKNFPDNAKQIAIDDIGKNIANIKKNYKSVDSWIALGNERKMLEDYNGAIEDWNYASALNPTNLVPFNNMGDTYFYYLKDYKKTEENFLTVIKLDPTYVIGYVNLYHLYHLSYQQNTNKDELILKQGLVTNPKAIDLMTNLASYYKEKGNKTNAVVYYKKALTEATLLKNQNLVDDLKKEISSLGF